MDAAEFSSVFVYFRNTCCLRKTLLLDARLRGRVRRIGLSKLFVTAFIFWSAMMRDRGDLRETLQNKARDLFALCDPEGKGYATKTDIEALEGRSAPARRTTA
ncbi:hypothetical protein CEXT_94571 [Caerostris extrusa]|uniref:EF-hand domain-containing protein n=1 Tax=Caerostris extrusa TaxID=172846 RepID=A0AAV4XW57_CAEEX|nr:hypothetical protein CEXT_94571 [Caerostris extrusa]